MSLAGWLDGPGAACTGSSGVLRADSAGWRIDPRLLPSEVYCVRYIQDLYFYHRGILLFQSQSSVIKNIIQRDASEQICTKRYFMSHVLPRLRNPKPEPPTPHLTFEGTLTVPSVQVSLRNDKGKTKSLITASKSLSALQPGPSFRCSQACGSCHCLLSQHCPASHHLCQFCSRP